MKRPKLVITAACIGAEVTKEDNPAVPYTVMQGLCVLYTVFSTIQLL